MTLSTRSWRPSPFGRSIPSPALIFSALAAMGRSFQNRRAARRLADYPDYLLSDLGLRRDDVHEALSNDWREDPTFRLAITAARRRRNR